MHRSRARRPGAGRLCDPRSDPPRISVRAAARRRPGSARGLAGANDARGRSLGRCRGIGAVTTKKSDSGRALKVRVKDKRKSQSSRAWLERQLNDPYVARATREGYRSRAAFKLTEIDDKARVLRKGARVVALGAAPGGWSQVAAKRVGAPEKGWVVGIDILPMEQVPGVEFAVMDFLAETAPERLKH